VAGSNQEYREREREGERGSKIEGEGEREREKERGSERERLLVKEISNKIIQWKPLNVITDNVIIQLMLSH